MAKNEKVLDALIEKLSEIDLEEWQTNKLRNKGSLLVDTYTTYLQTDEDPFYLKIRLERACLRESTFLLVGKGDGLFFMGEKVISFYDSLQKKLEDHKDWFGLETYNKLRDYLGVDENES